MQIDPADEITTTERLERLAARPGAEGLRLLAACWRIGAERGGTLAAVLDGLASALRDEEAQRQDVAAQLAGPRATARLLAGLPLLGLGMAAAMGANPLAFLFGTGPGVCFLTVGLALDAVGLGWTQRLARAAEAPR
ncbi:type II secretion system F family protein [Spirillospora sp. NPDC048911]|uniref:type II secretion system F family protein n=1 Tax=Spirillospora sp. NPDC048911 TaxID=3364527 RepID=UPI00371476AA